MLNAAQEERLARNEAFFREVNERIEDTATRLASRDDEEWEYLCECGDPNCTERVKLTRAEYKVVRSDPRRFVLAPGHVDAQIEHVVRADAERVVVEKNGLAGIVATQLDPRTT